MKKFLTYILILGLILMGIYSLISIYYPAYYKAEVSKYSQEFDVDPLLLLAIINTESSFNKKAISPKGAKGLMQISDRTGKWGSEELGLKNYSENDLFDPDTNIRIGAWYISKLMKAYDVKDTALAAYNAGSGNVNKWLDNKDYSEDGKVLYEIPFIETKNYVLKVNRASRIYEKLYFGRLPNDKDTLFDDFVFNIRSSLSRIKEKVFR